MKKNCACLAAILANILAHELELAQTLADDHTSVNLGRRAQLAEEIAANRAAFQNFVAGYQIQVKKRTAAPAPAGGC